MIHYVLSSNGSFTCGDTETGFTAYAYPSSPHATAARKHPEKVAREMLAREAAYLHDCESAREYDALNWKAIREYWPVVSTQVHRCLAIVGVGWCSQMTEPGRSYCHAHLVERGLLA